jgi:hypothetical protein
MEIRNDYTDDQNYTHIDFWPDEGDEGRTIAVVCRDTKKAFFLDNTMRNDSEVKKAIQEVLDECDAKVPTAEQKIAILHAYIDLLDVIIGNGTTESARKSVGKLEKAFPFLPR